MDHLKTIILNIIAGLLLIGLTFWFQQKNSDLVNENRILSEKIELKIISDTESKEINRRLMEEVKSLKKEYISDNSVLTERRKKKIYNLIADYQNQIASISPIALYMKTNDQNRLWVTEFDRPSAKIERKDVLDSLYELCSLYNFFETYSNDDVYQLPTEAAIALGKFYSTAVRDCEILYPTIHLLKTDSSVEQFAYRFTGLPFWGYESVEDHFNSVIKEAHKLMRVFEGQQKQYSEPQ